jgi:molybdate transport system substrate-binding protein
LAVLLVLATVVAACGDDEGDAGGRTSTSVATSAGSSSTTTAGGAGSEDDPELSGPLVVFAAASLTDVFEQLGDDFTASQPDVDLTFNFAASSELATQIVEGAPADVFASADERNMTKVVDAGAVAGEPVLFAANRLQIVVAEGNPRGIAALDDLTSGDLTVALCAPEVPCGSYAAQVFEKAGLQPPAASQEQNVRAVVEKVALGEADAGIGYTTDVLARAGEVDGVDIPEEQNVIAHYPVAVVEEGANPGAAEAWIQFLQTPEALAVLTGAGFLAP